MFGKLKLAAKLIGGFSIVLLITSVVGIAGVVVAGRLSVALEDMGRNSVVSIDAGADIVRQANIHRRAEMQHVLSDTAKDKAAQDTRLADVQKAMPGLFDVYAKTLRPDAKDTKAAFDDAKAAWTAYIAQTQKVTQLSYQQRDAEANALLLGTSREAFTRLETDLQKMADLDQKAADDSMKAGDKLYADSRFLLITAIILAIAIGLTLAITISRSIVGPVQKLVKGAEALAAGDLTGEKVRVSSKDEIGQLADAFNTMEASLKETVSQIMASAQQVAATSEELTASADTAAKATGEIAQAVDRTVSEIEKGGNLQGKSVEEAIAVVAQLDQAIQQIAQGSQDQAKSVTQTSNVLGQVATAVQQVAATTQNLAAASTQTAAAAEKGGQSVHKTIAGMDRIRNTVLDSSNRIKELGEYSQKIGQIVDVISEIAGQTNLLALNAAIEAARAGEHGKGFAVVADAVRSLAERASEATKEIGALIANIQTTTENAVRAMDAGTREVEEGDVLAREAGAALDEILRTVNDQNLQVQGITAATQQIAASSNEAVQAMDSVASVTEESTAATEEMAAGSTTVKKAVEEISAVSTQSTGTAKGVGAQTTEMTETVSAAVEEVASAASSLSSMAQELNRLVNKFKL